MSNFKISPVIQGKPAVPKRRSWSRFLLLIIVLETMVFGCWIFRLNTQITKLKEQIELMQTDENEEPADV
jgi:hypothetical protein